MTENQNFQPVMDQPTSTLAIVSLISGILSWCLIPILGAIVAIITGHLAKSEIRKSMEQIPGNGMATAGLVLGYLQIVLVVVSLCVIVILALLGPAIGNVFSNIIMEI